MPDSEPACGDNNPSVCNCTVACTPYGTKMESALLTRIFRHLLSHQTCSRLRYQKPWTAQVSAKHHGRRSYRSGREGRQGSEDRSMSNWQQRTEIFPPNKLKEYEDAPMVSSHALRGRRERPKRVKMLARDFIEGLYQVAQRTYRYVCLRMTRQSVQSQLRIFSKACHHLFSRSTFRLQFNGKRA